MGSEAKYNETTSKAYDVETNTLIVDIRNIHVNFELIGKALGIRDGGKIAMFPS